MNKNKIKFSNETNNENKQRNPQTNKIINKIMKKYNITEKEAIILLNKIEDNIKNNEINSEIQNNKKSNLKEHILLNTNTKPQQQTQNNTNTKPQQQTQDVNEILSDIIPDYNKNVSIEVKNIDLTFEVNTEKVDTVKETIIRTLKRNKPHKMKIHAINDMTFKIYKGEKVGIIGYNGAGKSTLLNVICGIYKPDKGEIKTNGNISPLLGLGAGFDYNYSGRRNIFFNGAVLGYDKQFLKDKEEEIIEFSELAEFIDIPIKNYSSGMLTKLGFSIATIVNPDILIIDEVLGVGDVTFAKKSKDKIKSLMDGGTTVLLVSHSIPQIRELCDKAIWIDQGKVKEIGEVNKVCDNYIKDSEKATNEQLANIQFR